MIMESTSQPTDQDFEVELAVKKEKISWAEKSGLYWLLIVFVLVLLAFSVSMFRPVNVPVISGNIGSSAEPVPELKQPRVYTVSYRNGVFSPTNLRVHAGDTVRFKNESIFPIRVVSDPHSSHDGLVGFDSVGDIPQNSFFSFTFAAKGIFGYHNEKVLKETGTIIVR